MPLTEACRLASIKTQFKPGQLVGDRAPHWKGGYLARYGLTYTEYYKILKSQGGGCGICGVIPQKCRLHIDHDHKTRKVRGLLCMRCNLGISKHFDEDPGKLHRAGTYLERAR